ncbi:MAG: HINT domain-containing protein [Saprospiraceae bacterium]|nr:HINT domain-containing protein [Saprospiraceae bacterium]
MTALKTYIVSAILAIVFNAQDTLWATPNHPFWHKGHYVEASALHAGDTIETLDGGYNRIQQIIPISGERRVYNITVAENSNYYVGSRGMLVHNDCFLKRLTDSPELIARIDALPSALKGQFIQDFYETGDDVIKVLKERPECVRAWESVFSNETVRKNINNLQKIDEQVVLNNTQHSRIKEAFEDAPDKQKFIDELQPKKTFHDNPADDVNGPLASSQDQIDELAVTNNPINNASKKFWWNHEKNVSTHLDNVYGPSNVGRQITVDITDQYGTFTVRLDNIVDVSKGTKTSFKISDSKSSINSNLSSESASKLMNSMSTPNQIRLYDAIEKGAIILAKPRGTRAQAFFGVQSNDELFNITFTREIDFFVNDFPA